jgi:methylated-DNA-[protein]-cysteine S-methyltransferase
MTTTTMLKPTKSSMTTIKQAFDGVPLVAQATIETPIGPLTALATSKGLAGLWFDAQKHHPGDLDAPVDAKHPHIVAAQRWLDAYWSGRDPSPRDVALDLHGTSFQRAVWKALLGIALGRTKTYGEIAAQVGNGAVPRENRATAPRAVGTAVGRNPVSILVPCHRVIGANGSLTGYAGGLPRKEKLLQHEGILLT